MREEAVIGGILASPEKMAEVAWILSSSSFTEKRCGDVFSVMSELFSEGEPIDLVSLYSRAPNFDYTWLSSISDSFSCNTVRYAEAIAAEHRKKEIESRLSSVVKSSNSFDRIMAEVKNIYAENTEISKSAGDIRSCVDEFEAEQCKNKERGSFGIPTGFDFFEKNFIEYVEGHMWTIGAFTSVGKTSLAIEMLCRVLPHSGAMVVSTEMRNNQNVSRILGNMSSIPWNVILSGRMLPKHEKIVNSNKDGLRKKNLILRDDLHLIADIEREVHKAVIRKKIKLVFVDFIQNILGDGHSEYERVSDVAKRLQKLAINTGVTMICLSQLSNQAANDDGGILQFKGAGDISAATDLGIILKRNQDDKRKMLCEVRKNRHGISGVKQVLMFNESWTRLDEI